MKSKAEMEALQDLFKFLTGTMAGGLKRPKDKPKQEKKESVAEEIAEAMEPPMPSPKAEGKKPKGMSISIIELASMGGRKKPQATTKAKKRGKK